MITVDRHFNGDFKPYVYRTSDYGATWQSIAGDLPQVYAHVAHRDRRNPHMYYAGLENGLYVSWDDGAQWYLFGLGLPNASVYDLAYQERRQRPGSWHAWTRGVDTRRPDAVPAVHARDRDRQRCTCFRRLPRCASGRGRRSKIWATALFYGKNPTYGAQLSYFLAQEVKEPGQLVITDSQGTRCANDEGHARAGGRREASRR